MNFTPEMPLRVASGTGVLAYEIVEGESYDLAFEGSTYRALHARSTGPDGTLRLGFIPDQLNGVDVGSIDGLSFSSEATGDDSNTLYFRTSNGGEIYHGATRVESLSLGSGPITTVQHGAGYVFALPQEVVDGTFTSLSNTSVRISWTAPLVGSQPLTYTIERDDNSDFTSPTTLVEDTAAVTHDDTGLTEATQYYYRVRASNYIGDGPYSAGTTVTGGVTPGVPTSVSASAVSTSAIDVTWGAPTTGTTPFTYTLQRATNSAFLCRTHDAGQPAKLCVL